MKRGDIYKSHFLDRIDGPALARLAWNVIFSLEHFGNGNHKLSSYKSGLGQGCSGYKENKKILLIVVIPGPDLIYKHKFQKLIS